MRIGSTLTNYTKNITVGTCHSSHLALNRLLPYWGRRAYAREVLSVIPEGLRKAIMEIGHGLTVEACVYDEKGKIVIKRGLLSDQIVVEDPADNPSFSIRIKNQTPQDKIELKLVDQAHGEEDALRAGGHYHIAILGQHQNLALQIWVNGYHAKTWHFRYITTNKHFAVTYF